MSDNLLERLGTLGRGLGRQFIIYNEAATEITRLRAENEKLREELEEMREACQANYMLGVERGKEDARDIAAAASAIRESGDE